MHTPRRTCTLKKERKCISGREKERTERRPRKAQQASTRLQPQSKEKRRRRRKKKKVSAEISAELVSVVCVRPSRSRLPHKPINKQNTHH
jgi:hypothetical protein